MKFFRFLPLLWMCWFALPLVGQTQTINPQPQWQQVLPTSFGFLEMMPLARQRVYRVGGTGTQPPYRRFLLFSNARGDTLSRPLTQIPARVTAFFGTIAEPDSGFLLLGFYPNPTPSSTYGCHLLHYDTLGHLTWERQWLPPSGMNFTLMRGIALPDGYLMQFDFNDGNLVPYGQLARLDKRGRVLWQVALPNNNTAQTTEPRTLVACADGAYVICNGDPYQYPQTGMLWDIDYWLARYSPQGVQLLSGYAGRRGDYDKPYHLRTTADGGFALVGSTRRHGPVYVNALTWSHFVKLDSLFRTQWTVSVPPTLRRRGTTCEYTFVEPLANGHFLISGYDNDTSAAIPWGVPMGVLAEIAPPTQPGDTLGRVIGQWQDPRAFGLRAIIDSTGTGYLFGSGTASSQWSNNTYLARYTGLGRPQAQHLCAQPPRLGPATWQLLGGRADSLAFSLEAATTAAGPRYGEISRVSWDFGDGSPNQLGWRVQHTFASPQPVRVRVCAMNNLWCQTCTDLYPFGVPTATPDDQLPLTVNVWPNPSADGRFHLIPPPAPSPIGRGSLMLTVTDALGRVVWRGIYSPSLGGGRGEEIDLSRCAPGVYTLHGQAGDGCRFNRKLVR